MRSHAIFIVGYGLLGALPFLQLLLIWAYLDAPQIGHFLTVASVSVILGAFCDGALSYQKAEGASDTAEGRCAFVRVGRLRLTRLALFAPMVFVAFALTGGQIDVPICICVLAASYCLNFAFIDRISGSAVKSLRDDAITRAHCQFLPSIMTILEPRHGTLIGCLLSLAFQCYLVRRKFRIRLMEVRPNFRETLSPDMMSNVLGLIHASFAQLTASLTLPAAQFAVFASIDRVVRASLLVSEPVRLITLRWSHKVGKEPSQGVMVLISAAVAVGVLLLLLVPFRLQLERLVFGFRIPFEPYLLVGSCITFISVSSLCIFVRRRLFHKLNRLFAMGVACGVAAYVLGYSKGPFVAALFFEVSVFFALAFGSLQEAMQKKKSR